MVDEDTLVVAVLLGCWLLLGQVRVVLVVHTRIAVVDQFYYLFTRSHFVLRRSVDVLSVDLVLVDLLLPSAVPTADLCGHLWFA